MFHLSSGLSWSGSSNTQEQSSPVTPEFLCSLGTLESPANETPISSFLSEFYDSDADPDANKLVHLSRGNVRQLDERIEKMMRNKRLPELPVGCLADHISPSLPNEVILTETPTPMPSTAAGCAPSEHSSLHTPADIWKSRRFCRNFGESAQSNGLNLIHNTFPTDLVKDLRVTHSPSSTFPLKHDLLPPPSHSEVSRLFSEKETATVREFLRMWGSNNRVKESRSKSALGEDGASGGDDDYSWEAAETEDGVDPRPCSMLLHEVSKMVGLPPEQSRMEDQFSIASTPPGLGTLDQLTQNDQGFSQNLDLSSSYQPAALVRSSTNISSGDDFDVGDRATSGVCQHVDQPLDVAPRAPATHGVLAGSNTSIRGYQDESVTPKSMDVPIILATSPDATFLRDPSCDSFMNRQRSPGRARPTDGNMKRRGQIFNVEEARIPAVSIGALAINVDRTFVPTREPPPPPPPLPTLSAKRVSALNFSLSRLKAHGSQQQKSSTMEKADARGHVSSKDRGPPLFTASRERKHQSGVTTRPYPRSAHGRHFSSPMLNGAPMAPRPTIDPIHAHLRERAAKLFPCPENREVTMRSFMEMDVAPPKAQLSRRTSRIGRVAARLSQGISNFGKNFLGSRSIKEHV